MFYVCKPLLFLIQLVYKLLLGCRFMSNITDQEMKLVERIGYAIIWQQQKCMVLSVWSLIAAVLLQHRNGISVPDLTQTIRWLKKHANNVGAYIDWPGDGE